MTIWKLSSSAVNSESENLGKNNFTNNYRLQFIKDTLTLYFVYDQTDQTLDQ